MVAQADPSASDARPAPEVPDTWGGRYGTAMGRLSGAQKTAKGAPAYSRYINRRLGRHLAAAAYAFGATPNQVTVLSGACTLSAVLVVALAPPTIAVGLIVCALFVLGYALDSADGQLARVRGSGSASGEWLDHTFDVIKTSTLHVAVVVSVFRYFDVPSWVLLVPLLYGAVAGIFFFTVVLTDQLRRANAAKVGTRMPDASTRAPLWRSLVVLPTDFGALCLVFATLGWHQVFLGLYGLLGLGSALFLLAALPTWYREVASFGRPAP